MEPARVEDLAVPGTANDWLFDFRRRELRTESQGLALGDPGDDSRRSTALRSRSTTRDPLADCLAFAAGWEAPPSAAADVPESLDTILDPRN